MLDRKYSREQRRALNIIWNAAGRYGWDPYFMAFQQDGKPDFYFNTLLGLSDKYLGADRVEAFFSRYESAGRREEFDDLLWLALESWLYARELPGRPALAGLRREHAQRFFRELQLLSRVSVGPGGILEADLVRRNVVALEGARSYHVWLAAVEGMLQGAAMAFDFAPPRVQGPFSLSKIGVVLLGRPPCGWPLRLAVKRIWDAQGVVHCDAQAIDPQGGCVACATNIEFDGARPAVPADADGL